MSDGTYILKYNEADNYAQRAVIHTGTLQFLPTTQLPDGPTYSVDGRAYDQAGITDGIGFFQVGGDGAALYFTGQEVGSGLTVNMQDNAAMEIDGNGFHALVASMGVGAVIAIPDVALPATSATLVNGMLRVMSGSETDAAFRIGTIGGGTASLADLTFTHTGGGFELLTAK